MRSRLPLVLAALAAGCGAPSPTSSDDRVSGTPIGSNAGAAPAEAPEPSAKAIHIEEDTDRLEYELAIPAEAVALPRLKAKLLAQSEKAKAEALDQQADYVKTVPEGPGGLFNLHTEWVVKGQTPQLLSLVGNVSSYTGGAHGSAGTTALLWNRAVDREVPLTTLFTDRTKALATIRPAYCKALDAARLERRGYVLGKASGFAECPPFSDLTVAPAGNVGGKFSRILIIADPYVAGSWAEGPYEVELVIPKPMIPFVAPAYRTSFPG